MPVKLNKDKLHSAKECQGVRNMLREGSTSEGYIFFFPVGWPSVLVIKLVVFGHVRKKGVENFRG